MPSSKKNKLMHFARLGYAARGVIYLIVGGFAILAASGSGGGKTTGSKGALRSLLGEPFGEVLLGIIALGLVCYSLWRLVQAVLDADHHGTTVKGLGIRAALLVSAVTHALLAVFSLSLIFGLGMSGNGNEKGWTVWLMNQPFGRWLVICIGLAVIIAGIANIIKGLQKKYKKRFDMNQKTMRWASPVCAIGLAARGVAFFIIGGSFIYAGVTYNAQQATGMNGALDALQRQAFGRYLLGALALGLIAFGIYSLIEAIYRRISV